MTIEKVEEIKKLLEKKTKSRVEKIKKVVNYRQDDLTVVLENIHDPHNVSAIFRTCDAVGVYQVNLVYTIEKFPEIGKKSSAGTRKWIEKRHFSSIKEAFETLKKEGFTIYASYLSEDAISLYDIDLTQKVALVFGNEHRGVSEDVLKYADYKFIIPMVGMVQSLNVSVAAAVSLYEAFRQRLKKGKFSKPVLSQDKYLDLLKKYLEK